MKYMKGIIVGSAIGAGVMMMYKEGLFKKKKMKQLVKKMNIF